MTPTKRDAFFALYSDDARHPSDGKIIEQHDLGDMLTLPKQLGAVP